MLLREFMEELAFGELVDLSLSENGTINPTNQPKIVIALNDAISSLYTRYVIKVDEAVLDMTEKRKSYVFDNPNSVKIIWAGTYPDYMDEVSAPDPIYQSDSRRDAYTILGNTVQYKNEPKADYLRVVYQFVPTKLAINPTSRRYLEQTVTCRTDLVPLVRTMVAGTIFSNMNGELHKATGVNLINKSQIMIAEKELSGALDNGINFESKQFNKNGFR